MDEVQVTPEGRKQFTNITTLDRDVVLKLPAANSGVESLLKLLPGVSFNNELSTQYNVREILMKTWFMSTVLKCIDLF